MSLQQYFNIEGINPKVWGKCGWKFLGAVALVYNPNKNPTQRECYKSFFSSLRCVLPCNECGENLEKELTGLNEALEDNKSLLKWLLKIRNNILIEQGKNKITLKEMILEIFSENNSTLYQWIWICVLIAVLILLIYLLKFYSDKKNKKYDKKNEDNELSFISS